MDGMGALAGGIGMVTQAAMTKAAINEVEKVSKGKSKRKRKRKKKAYA